MRGTTGGKTRARRSVPFDQEQAFDALLIGQGRILANQNRAANASLAESEFKVFSQWGEDGIIQRLIDMVPIANRNFIEFGVETFAEANCRYLMVKDNWRGFVIDGDPANMATLRQREWFWKYDLQATAAFIDADNIDTLLKQSGFEADLGILSVDIDGNDYWVLGAITSYRPRILITEFNSVFGADRAISVPYDPGFVRTRAHYSNLYWGASLGAFAHWASGHGYTLVHVGSAGVNAFFVRDDVLPPEIAKRTVAEAYQTSRFRESRDEAYRLSYVSGPDRLALISGMPVIDVVTGEATTL